ncbi:MAG: GNAT family N-acetyltransferase [Deltaproteobacteria bacterium]
MLKIKKVEAEDISEVKKLLTETWIDTYGSILSKEAIEKVTSVWHEPTKLERQANDENIIFNVAVDDYQQMVGLITIAKNDGDIADLLRLYVLPDKQRQGIGKLLLDNALTQLGLYKKLRLEVEEKNEKGKAFYTKIGFRTIDTNIENVEGEELNTIIMEKALQFNSCEKLNYKL